MSTEPKLAPCGTCKNGKIDWLVYSKGGGPCPECEGAWQQANLCDCTPSLGAHHSTCPMSQSSPSSDRTCLCGGCCTEHEHCCAVDGHVPTAPREDTCDKCWPLKCSATSNHEQQLVDSEHVSERIKRTVPQEEFGSEDPVPVATCAEKRHPMVAMWTMENCIYCKNDRLCAEVEQLRTERDQAREVIRNIEKARGLNAELWRQIDGSIDEWDGRA